MTNISVETQPVFINLASAVADALECPECPKDLRDALNDSVVNELINLFSPSNPLLLRALVQGVRETGPEAETPVVGQSERKAAAYTH